MIFKLIFFLYLGQGSNSERLASIFALNFMLLGALQSVPFESIEVHLAAKWFERYGYDAAEVYC